MLETRIAMQQYDELDTFEKIESWPTIEEIEQHLRKLGCTKEQVRRHLDQVAISRIEPPEKSPSLARRAVDAISSVAPNSASLALLR